MECVNKQTLILEAAQKRFIHYGYGKTSLDEIAGDLGIGKATIYHYFKNKEDIFLHVLKQESSSLRKTLQKSLEDINSPREKLKIFLAKHFEFMSGNVNVSRLMLDPWRNLQPLFDKGLREFYNEQFVLLRGILQEGIREKSFRQMDVKQVSVLLLSLLRSFFIPGFRLEKTYSHKKMVRTFMNIVSDGIGVQI